MADNVVVTAGTGTTVAADEVVDGTLGTVKVQYVKIMDATLDGTTKAAVGANGLAVDVKALPTLAAVTTVSTVTNLSQLGGAAISMGTGVRGTGVQRVTVATDDLVPVTGTITAVTAITNALPAGTALMGKVGIDQTTDGTTNKVAADVRFAGVAADKGSGTGGSATQRIIIDSSQFGALGATTKSASTSVARATDDVLGFTITQSATMTRAATTPTYASGQLFANSTVAGSVVNLSWTTAARISGGSGVIIGASVQKNGNTTTGAAFRIHLFTIAPTYVTNGDTSPLTTVVVASAKGYLGYIDITTMVGFSDVAWGSGAPDNSRGGIPFVAAAQTLFGLIEARGAYVGVSGEILTVFLDILQD